MEIIDINQVLPDNFKILFKHRHRNISKLVWRKLISPITMSTSSVWTEIRMANGVCVVNIYFNFYSINIA